MAIRGSVVLECDRKGCHAELVIGDLEFQIDHGFRNEELEVTGFAPGWREDEHGLLVCPDCAGHENPRDKHDDDGATYADPRDFRDGRE